MQPVSHLGYRQEHVINSSTLAGKGVVCSEGFSVVFSCSFCWAFPAVAALTHQATYDTSPWIHHHLLILENCKLDKPWNQREESGYPTVVAQGWTGGCWCPAWHTWSQAEQPKATRQGQGQSFAMVQGSHGRMVK